MDIYYSNLWDDEAKIKIITTNGVINGGRLVMGAGVAKQASIRYPGIDKYLADNIQQAHKYNKKVDSFVYYVETFPIKDEIIVAFQTKFHWRNSSSLSLIAAGTIFLNILLEDRFSELLYTSGAAMAFPGIGMGGLSENEVKPLLEYLNPNIRIYKR